MRVCLVTREYPKLTAYSGGIGTQFATLAPELARQGHDTHVIVPADAYPAKREGEYDGVVAHFVPRARLGWSFAVKDALRAAGQFDVVFAPEWSGDAWWYSRDKSMGPLVTNLTTSLDQILSLNRQWQRNPKQRILHGIQARRERAQTERSDALIACSHAIRRWAGELWELEDVPTAVIPNMVDIELIRSLGAGTAELPEDHGRPLIAFSGRLEIRKGVHVLVEAMRGVWEAFPEAELVLCGNDAPWRSGSMRDHLLELARTRARQLRFMGNLPPERLYPTLRQADVVVLPSLWENFSLAALESLTLARPLVATRSGGFEEMIAHGENGILVAPTDAAALARALVDLLSDEPKRARLGAAGAAHAERFGKERVTAEHVGYFEQIANGRA